MCSKWYPSHSSESIDANVPIDNSHIAAIGNIVGTTVDGSEIRFTTWDGAKTLKITG